MSALRTCFVQHAPQCAAVHRYLATDEEGVSVWEADQPDPVIS